MMTRRRTLAGRLLDRILARLAPASLGVSRDCRDGVHEPGCQICDCPCHHTTSTREGR